MTDAEFIKAQAFVTAKKREADQAVGRRDQLISQLKEEFQCATSAEANALLKQLEAEEKTAQTELAAERAAFETKWGKVLV